MPLITAQTQFSAGQYSIVADVGTGDVTLQISVSGGPLVDITNGQFTEDATSIIDLPLCSINPVLTGTATVSIDNLKS